MGYVHKRSGQEDWISRCDGRNMILQVEEQWIQLGELSADSGYRLMEHCLDSEINGCCIWSPYTC